MKKRGETCLRIILAVFLTIAACGDDESSSENNGNNTNNQTVGEWNPELCEGGTDEDGDGLTDCADPDCYDEDVCVFEPGGFTVPDLPLNGVISLWERSSWYFENGELQRGVQDGVITPENIGTVRGRIVDADGNPITGASVSLAGLPEMGRTYTRDDGRYDLAFDAGRRLVIRVSADGFITSDRELPSRLQRPNSLEDIVLVPYEDEPTLVDFSGAHFVEGTTTSDEDGERRTAVIIPEGTRASLTFPNGARQPLEQMNVRATEVTVGDTGRDAMMAELPPSTLYTYAAEFTVDEAEEANADGVEFSQPVFVYVDNFTGFAPGTLVPSGFYDRGSTSWEPQTDGLVIEITGVSGGLAEVSSTEPLGADELEALRFTDAERRILAENYEVGDTLWRVPTKHFSPHDYNWLGLYPPGTAAPPGAGFGGLSPSNGDACVSQEVGSMIGCSSQTLGERIRLDGTPFTLAYNSGRTLGRKPVISVPVLPIQGNLNPQLLAAQVSVTAAGQPLGEREFFQRLDIPRAEEFIWDGRDQFGRAIQGTAEVEVVVKLVYAAFYATRVSGNVVELPPTGVSEIPPEFGSYQAEDGVNVDLGRALIVITRKYSEQVTAGTYDAAREGLGGWTLDAQHRYDPVGRTMYYGNGQDLPAGPDDRVFEVVAGASDEYGFGNRPPDGANARETVVTSLFKGGVDLPYSAVGHDGTVYFKDFWTVRAIDPRTNLIRTIAGEQPDFDAFEDIEEETGDGGPAADARFIEVKSLRVGKDGRLYIESRDHIWRIERDGTINAILGTPRGLSDFEDGAPASTIRASWDFFDASADGVLYFGSQAAVYRRTLDGRVRHVITDSGRCENEPCGDGERAIGNRYGTIRNIAVARSGDLYFAEDRSSPDGISRSWLRRVRPDGTLETYAETPYIRFLEIGPGDGVFISIDAVEDANLGAGVLQVMEDGEIVPRVGIFQAPQTVVQDIFGFIGEEAIDGESALRPVDSGWPFSFTPSGETIFHLAGQIVRLKELFPGYSGSNYQIATPGGAVIDEFEPRGQHLRSFDALTGVPIWNFEYDEDGRLLSATDRDGDITEIVRDGQSRPTAIVGPNGVTWTTAVDESGMLTTLTTPEGEVWSFGYDEGLMTSMTNPRGESWTFRYDEAGRLIADDMPNGGTSTLERDPELNSVLFTTPEGRQTDYRETPPTNSLDYRGRFTGDLSVQTSQLRDGWSRTETQDGTVTRTRTQSHPVYGMIASYPAQSRTVLPSGLAVETETTQTATSAAAELASGLDEWEYTTTDGTSTLTRSWDPMTQTLSVETGEGREASLELDSLSRPAVVSSRNVEPVSYSYDAQGRVVGVTQGARSISMSYNTNGYLSAVTTDDGTTQFSRDLMGRIARGDRPDGTFLTFGYDDLGLLTRVTPPSRPDYSMTSDVRGNLLSMTMPSGEETVYEFDLDYRLSGMTLGDAREASVTYDDSNRVDSVVLDGSTFDYTYAATGQLAGVAGGDADLALTWDGPLPLTKTASGVASGSVGWTWADGTLRLETVDINGTEIDYTYDDDGVPTQIGDQLLDYAARTTFLTSREVGGVETTYRYNDFGELESMRLRSGGADLLRMDYTYDTLGRITEIEENDQGSTTTYAYSYDEIGQLVQVDATGGRTFTHTYTYDDNGNRTAVSNSIDDLAGAEITHNDDDQLIRYDDISYAYNPAGQLRSKTRLLQATTFDYGVLGELEQVEFPSGRTIEYEHDSLRRRVARKVDGTYTHRFIYGNNINPIAEVDAGGDTVSTFVYGTGINVPDYMIRGGRTYYFARDHLGSVRYVIDVDDQSIAQVLRYDEFGQVTSDSNPGFQPFGFAGGLYDEDTGLTRFGVRDYEARTGRWTARDPIGFGGGQANLYVYAGNDAMNFVDPEGEAVVLSALLISLAIGAVSSAVFSGVGNAYSVGGDRAGEAFWIGVKYGWIGAVPGGGYFSGKWIAEANIEACLVNPADPDSYVRNSALHGLAGSAIGGGVGLLGGPYGVPLGAAVGTGFSLTLDKGEEIRREVQPGMRGLKKQWDRNRQRKEMLPNDYR